MHKKLVLLMEEILQQLINIPLFTGFDIYIPGGAGFLPSTVSGKDKSIEQWP